MKTFIMIVMLCHLDINGQEGCIPMTPTPQIYYTSKQECNNAAIVKREEMREIAIDNSIRITEIYSTCIEEKSSI